MKVVLLADVQGTGKKGDVKDVADGYARNFLLPKKFAAVATKAVLEQLKAQEERRKKEMEDELHLTQKLASKLDGGEIEIQAKAGQAGTFYSAVSAGKIVQKIKQQFGIDIKPTQIQIKQPIKECGEHIVIVKFSHGLEAEVRVIASVE